MNKVPSASGLLSQFPRYEESKLPNPDFDINLTPSTKPSQRGTKTSESRQSRSNADGVRRISKRIEMRIDLDISAPDRLKGDGSSCDFNSISEHAPSDRSLALRVINCHRHSRLLKEGNQCARQQDNFSEAQPRNTWSESKFHQRQREPEQQLLRRAVLLPGRGASLRERGDLEENADLQHPCETRSD